MRHAGAVGGAGAGVVRVRRGRARRAAAAAAARHLRPLAAQETAASSIGMYSYYSDSSSVTICDNF